MQYSIAEMTDDLRPVSSFTRWQYDQFIRPPSFVEVGGTWPLGDSPLVLLTALSSETSRYEEQPVRRLKSDLTYGAPMPGRRLRLYKQLDARLVFADFLALLRIHAAQ